MVGPGGDYVNLFLIKLVDQPLLSYHIKIKPVPYQCEILNMPDKRTHRGAHPDDPRLFRPAAISELAAAVADFSLLLTKDYAEKSALKLVGDKFSLTKRQRLAVMRSACSDRKLESRKKRELKIADLKYKPLAIDGYNLLITIEAAMSGAYIFIGRDGCFRDLSGIHGTYRKVTETIPSVRLIGDFLKEIDVSKVLWLLDSPVSNSGRLKKLIGRLAEENAWNWPVELVLNPDTELIKTKMVTVSSDSVVLDNCDNWANLARAVIEQKLPQARIMDLSQP